MPRRADKTGVRMLFLTSLLCLPLFPLHGLAEQGGITQPGGLALDSTIERYIPDHDGLTGRLSIAGSDTMNPLVSKLAARFMSSHPGIKIAVDGVGTHAAIREFQLGHSYQRRGDKARGKGNEGATRVELLASSRGLTEDELAGFESNHGYRPIGIPIAMDALAIYVHKDNPLPQLTLAQLDGIFGKERKRGHAPVVTWKQAGLLEGALAQQPLRLYGRDKRSGTRAVFKHLALLDGELNEEVIEQPGSASTVLAIAQDSLAIGYAGVGFQMPSVRLVPIASKPGEPALLPSQDNVLSEVYPLSRPLYLYVKKSLKEELDQVVSEFLSFINSWEGQEMVGRAGLYPLTGVHVTRNRQALRLSHGAMMASPEPSLEMQRAAEVGGAWRPPLQDSGETRHRLTDQKGMQREKAL
ncbi:MAG: PstS family phosphate ABC transporter substrate-binding protein [Nitrospira sp.]|nr:PstS family phosphate ABC transporter substrate-binding protein [Nitrospira sp.]